MWVSKVLTNLYSLKNQDPAYDMMPNNILTKSCQESLQQKLPRFCLTDFVLSTTKIKLISSFYL